MPKASSEFLIQRARIHPKDFLGESPTLPGHEKHEVSRGVAELRVGPVDDADEKAGGWIDQDVPGLEAAVDQVQRTVGGW